MGVTHEFDTQKPWWGRWSRRKVLLAVILTPVVFLGAPLLLLVVLHWIQSPPSPEPAPRVVASPRMPLPRKPVVASPAPAPAPAPPAVPELAEPRIHFDSQVTMLGDARALVFGGHTRRSVIGDTFLLDIATLTFTRTSPMIQPREYHRALRLPDGSVLALGGLLSLQSTPTQSDDSLPAERWDPQSMTWTAVPGLDIAERDFQRPVVLLTDGRVVGFEGLKRPPLSGEYAYTELSRAWAWDPQSGTRTYLPPAPSEREKYSAIPLDGGRLALVGGNTPRDFVALERECDTCAEEYVRFGESVPSTSTDIFDFATGRWSEGPAASQGGGFAIRLRDGRIFKLSLVPILDGGPSKLDLLVEVSDRKFTKWTRAGQVRLDTLLPEESLRMFESHDGVAILMSQDHSFLWSADKLVRWKLDKPWADVYAIDDRRLLMNVLEADQYRNFTPVAQIVEIP